MFLRLRLLPQAHMPKKFTIYHQTYSRDCGPTCLRMIAKHYGKIYSLEYLREKTGFNRGGVSLGNLSIAAEYIGFKTMSATLNFDSLRDHAPLPCIAYWKHRHFVVIYRITRTKVYVADPAHGLLTFDHDEFITGWKLNKHEGNGLVLLMEPTPSFYDAEPTTEEGFSWTYFTSYLKPYRKYVLQLFLGMLLGTLFSLIFPFLTQSVIDIGVGTQNMSFITLIFVAQIMLTVGRLAMEFIRSWILLHISTRINILFLSDFLTKLLKLPISFFDTKNTGDILQRISDQKRIESFLSISSLSFIFSFFSLIAFSVVLMYYNMLIFGVFFIGSALYAGWVILFLKKRRQLDYKSFTQSSNNQSNLIQLITGIQEIKLHNAEISKRWEWERIRAQQFKLSITSLSLSQLQQIGSTFINETKNIVITFVAVGAVVKGEISLGMMLATQYIIGQLNAPVTGLIGFANAFQDAKISVERIGDVYNKEDEEKDASSKISELSPNETITFRGVSFKYPGSDETVLSDINFRLLHKKTTAVVGMSGSGKTTLIKLILKFHEVHSGEILFGNINFNHISVKAWRDKCSAVLQDGFIFNDTIVRNIAVKEERIDWERIFESTRIANIHTFIEELPMGYETRIGASGQGLSQGQKQRILMARSIYKNPDFVLFDEATNALDANNEKVILENLENFFSGKTVMIIAHRLSTVVNADQIIVLDKGSIAEIGTHDELLRTKGKYYQLVKNQLKVGVGDLYD